MVIDVDTSDKLDLLHEMYFANRFPDTDEANYVQKSLRSAIRYMRDGNYHKTAHIIACIQDIRDKNDMQFVSDSLDEVKESLQTNLCQTLSYIYNLYTITDIISLVDAYDLEDVIEKDCSCGHGPAIREVVSTITVLRRGQWRYKCIDNVLEAVHCAVEGRPQPEPIPY